MRSKPVWHGAAVALALLSGCAQPAAIEGLEPATLGTIPGWRQDTLAQTLPALQAGCRRLGQLPPDTVLGGAGLAAQFGGQAGRWATVCTAARSLVPGDEAGARRFYEQWFQPYRIAGQALITGYYEPEVPGALAPGGAYSTPLLARPADLLRGPPPAGNPDGPPSMGRLEHGQMVPYWSRAEIEAGRAGAAARPLLWVAGPADLFLLQVQGAGRIRLADGSVIRVAYDGKNGRPTTPIGRVLIERGALAPADVTMQTIRAWLAVNPGQAGAVMDRNEDYVFFRVLTGADPGLGPPGALGTNLLAGRAAAVDRHAVPLGTPLFIDTTDPVTGALWRRLVLAQDSGTDIVGAARAGLFLGSGGLAEQQAGRMHQAGTAYMLLPRPAL